MFYLSSHDYVNTPEPRLCEYTGNSTVRQTGQIVLRVDIVPPLPGELAGNDRPIMSLLLGIIDPTLSIADIGRVPFLVDIYVPKNHGSGPEYDATKIERIGVGLLHAEMAEAITASPLGD